MSALPLCPDGMARIPGGEFWVGSERHSPDERPRFRTALAPFCLDLTEVTVRAYQSCVERGECTPAQSDRRLCNAGREGRDDHPVNCVDQRQAQAFCTANAARLPSEIEWEYAARGGVQALRYPWGDAELDGRTCWKHNGTCAVKSYAAGAFGLYDMSGNVWEWTDTWYGPYPFPPETGFAKVYRGGSFSRRFAKWMHLGLRNRAAPDDLGSHLGFRCASTPKGVTCPFGVGSDGRCLHGVLGRECAQGQSWNGVRCAAPGAARCASGTTENAGFGCVPRATAPSNNGARAENAERDLEAEARLVNRARTQADDADCELYQARRPHAYRYAGGSHQARTLLVQRQGCKNRDVGVGWNSACCP